MDLSPREVVPTAAGRKRKRPWLALGVLLVVVLAGGALVVKFLTSAIDYYCNVDEIGVKDGCEIGRQIRIQGVVDKGSVSETGEGVEFVISYNGESMPVVVGSEPTGIFQQCIPVVVSGRVTDTGDGLLFEGDEVIVKHDNEYDAEHKDRVDQADDEAAACSQKD